MSQSASSHGDGPPPGSKALKPCQWKLCRIQWNPGRKTIPLLNTLLLTYPKGDNSITYLHLCAEVSSKVYPKGDNSITYTSVLKSLPKFTQREITLSSGQNTAVFVVLFLNIKNNFHLHFLFDVLLKQASFQLINVIGEIG